MKKTICANNFAIYVVMRDLDSYPEIAAAVSDKLQVVAAFRQETAWGERRQTEVCRTFSRLLSDNFPCRDGEGKGCK